MRNEGAIAAARHISVLSFPLTLTLSPERGRGGV
jgi:hypothetical protein